jgi:hypothetical protein
MIRIKQFSELTKAKKNEAKRILLNFVNPKLGTTSIKDIKKKLNNEDTDAVYEGIRRLFNRHNHRTEQKHFKELKNKKREENKQTSYEVLIRIEEAKTWKGSGSNTTTYHSRTPFRETFVGKNVDSIKDAVNKFVQNQYPLEESAVIVELDSFDYEIINVKVFKKTDKKDVGMKRAYPYKASFLKYFDKVNPISLETGNGECVLDCLSNHLKVEGKPMKRDNLKKVFNDASINYYKKPYDKKDGITANMILYLCKQKNISCIGFDQNNSVFIKNVRDEKKSKTYRTIIFYMFLNHFYLINDEKTVAHISQKFKQNTTFTTQLQIDKQADKPEDKQFYNELSVKECLKLPPNSVVLFKTFNLNEIYKEYVEITGDAKPKLKYGSITGIHEIDIPNGISLQVSKSYGDNIEWSVIHDICKANDILANNQSLGELIIQFKDKFFKTSRKQFTKNERETVMSKSKGNCNVCGDNLLGVCQIDHIRPLSNGGNNDDDNLQALCKNCHREKTMQEHDNCDFIRVNEFSSCFNTHINKLLETNVFRKVAFTEQINDNEPPYGCNLYCIDINKCRKNILINYSYDFCKFSVLDNIEPFDGVINDGLYYIECENKLPLRGNQFYSRPMVEYGLSISLFCKSDIKYQLKPSRLIPKSYFKDFVAYLLDIFKENTQLQKNSINYLVGLFGRRNNMYYENRICNKNDIDDIASHYEELSRPYINEINEDIVSIVGEVKINKIDSYFPIHLQILDCEAIELHKILTLVEEEDGVALCVKTDAVIYSRRKEININDYYWDEAKEIKKYKHENNFKELQRPIKLKHLDKLVINPHEYFLYKEQDNFDLIVDDIINSSKGCLILGPAGAGKTTLLNKIIEKLDVKKILRLAPTNKSALLIDGETLDKFTYNFVNGGRKLSKYKFIEYILIDEISMVRELFYQVLLTIKNFNPNIKFIISGDFYQLPPVGETLKSSYENSRALFELVDGFKLNLEKCRRSDDFLFNICKDVKSGVEIDVSIFNSNKNYLNVCYTNRIRKYVNNECMKKYIKENQGPKLDIKKLQYDKNSQDITIMKGMPLICRINQKSIDIVNNEMFKVIKVMPNEIVVKNEMKEIIIPLAKINQLFHLGFCITIHKSQGETFDRPYSIYEWNTLNKTLKYVALSRSSDIKYINIV